MTRMLSWSAAPLALYAALLADVMLLSAGETRWLPNLVLLAAFRLVRTPGGVAWSAVAGLMCDGVSGKPLGVTMLAATLAATVYRDAIRDDARSVGWLLVKVFVFVAAIDCGARLVAETVSATPEIAEALVRGIQTAIATAGVAAVLLAFRGLAKRISTSRDHDLARRYDIGGIR